MSIQHEEKPRLVPVTDESEILVLKQGGLGAPFLHHIGEGYYVNGDDLKKWREGRASSKEPGND